MRLLKGLTVVAMVVPLTAGALVSAAPVSAAPVSAARAVPAAPVVVGSPVGAARQIEAATPTRAGKRRTKYVPLDAALAKKCMKKLYWAVQYGGDNIANAVGLLEVEVSSFQGQYAALKAQVIDMAIHESYNVKMDLRRLDNELWRGLQMWNSGNRRKAVQWWNAVLRTELLPSLRTYVGAFRAKAETLSREAKAALTALDKPWVINPDVDDRMEQAFDKVQASLNAAWKIATKRARR